MTTSKKTRKILATIFSSIASSIIEFVLAIVQIVSLVLFILSLIAIILSDADVLIILPLTIFNFFVFRFTSHLVGEVEFSDENPFF